MIVEDYEKEFTKKKRNNIIKEDYNLLKVNKSEREGLSVRESKDVVIKDIEKGLTLEEKQLVREYSDICIKLYRNGMIDCFNYYNK